MHYILMGIIAYISCIVYDLGTLEVIWNIKVMGYLQVNNLFIVNLWT